MITPTDLICAKISYGRKMSDSELIRNMIKDDVNSAQKKTAAKAKAYYQCDHDIKNHDFRKSKISETDDNGNERIVDFINPNRSNLRVTDPFHKILVDQKASYLVGREPTISLKGEDKAYQDFLSGIADNSFNELIHDYVIEASNSGAAVLHFYYDDKGELRSCIVPFEEVILIYDEKYQRDLTAVMRYYSIKVYSGNEYRLRKKVEIWTPQDVTYYIEQEENEFVIDGSYPVNPMPHWWSTVTVDGMIKKKEPHSWGRLPFVVIENNRDRINDLKPVKGLIDAYDMLSSAGVNDFVDLVSLYWAIVGYGGEAAQAIVKKLQINRAVNISGADGSIEAKQVNLSEAGRIEYLNMLRRDIYHFGMGVDTDNDKLGNASGVSLKFQYTLLDLKANAMAAKLRNAIKDYFWFVTDDYNRLNGTAYNSDDIVVTINKTMITNDLETVNMICSSEGIVSKQTLLENHPMVSDVNEELKRLEKEERDNIEAFAKYGLKEGGEGDDK